MDVVLVNPSPSGQGLNEATIESPLGLAYIAAVLEQQGFTCSIIDANVLRLSPSKVVQRIPPDTKLIGFYVNSFTYSNVSATATACRKEFPNTVVVIGGPLASVISEQIIREIPCHGAIRGEGEYALVRIMENLSKDLPVFGKDVPGAAYLSSRDGSMVLNPVVRIKDLDAVPFPAYHLLPDLRLYRSRARKRPVAGIVTSRGCCYRCIFCSKDVFGGHVTLRSPDNVLAEIDYLVSHLGVHQIDVLDDDFTYERSRVEAILDGLIDRHYDLVINLQTGIRTEKVDDQLLAKMKRAGVYKLAFGIESADPRVLRICRKHLDLNHAKTIIRSAKAMGFLVYGFFIIGLPMEDEGAFRLTMEFAREMDFDVANFTMAIPFVGTELYNMVAQEGRLLVDTARNIDTGFYGGQAFYELGGITGEAVERRYRTAYHEFYSFGKKVRMLTSLRSLAEIQWSFRTFCSVIRGTGRILWQHKA